MCSGGGGGSYSAPKVDPVPTVVQSSDTGVDTSAGNRQKRKRGAMANTLTQDRAAEAASILGGATNTGAGTRKTLG